MVYCVKCKNRTVNNRHVLCIKCFNDGKWRCWSNGLRLKDFPMEYRTKTVDVLLRNGHECTAKMDHFDEWGHFETDSDILYYRLHKPEKDYLNFSPEDLPI